MANNISAASPADAEAIRLLKDAIKAGKHWYVALLEAMGRWASAEETINGLTYRYLIDGEAFDWLLLAERLCQEVDNLLPQAEKDDLLFRGKAPLSLATAEARALIGGKYHQYLNFFYGVTVETALLQATEAEVYKERWMLAYTRDHDVANESFRRIYGASRAALLKRFRQQKHYPQRRSITLSELKEFTYWLFKFRLEHVEKARIASDTKKALDYLRCRWAAEGVHGTITGGEAPPVRRA